MKRIRTRINKENLEKAQKEGHITEEQAQEVIDTNGLYNPYTDTYINPDILPEISVTAKAPERTWTSEWTYNDPEFRLAREHRNIAAQEVAKSTRDKMNQVGNAIGKTIIGGTSFTPLWFAAPIAKAGIAASEGDYSGAAKEAAVGLLAPYAIGKGLEKGYGIYKAYRGWQNGLKEGVAHAFSESGQPVRTSSSITGRDFWIERPAARISEAERLGIPKGERNQPYKEKIPVSTTFNSPDIPIINISKMNELQPLELSRLKASLNKSNNQQFYQTLDYFQTNDFPIIKELSSKDYITAARNYYTNLGIDISRYSDETIAKVLTDSYNQLKTGQSGILKGKVLWHGSGFKPFDILDPSKSGEFTGNQGLYGNGFYLTNYPNSYGQHGYYNTLLNKTKYINNSQPYLVDGVREIGGNPLVETNSYGLAWHQPEGNLTIPYGPTKTYNRLYFKSDNPFGIPEGYQWVARNSDGSFRLAPKDFKGYNIRKGKFSEGQFYLKDQGTGYKVALGNNSWLSKNKGRAFQSRQTIDSSSSFAPQLIPSYIQDGIEYPATELVVPYSSSVKSLIPHPSTASGTSFVRNWKDPRINYIIGAPFIVGMGLNSFNKKQGGKLNYLNYMK